MKIYMSIDDLIGWILIGGGILFFVVLWIYASIVSKIKDFKDRKEKKKREKEANGE